MLNLFFVMQNAGTTNGFGKASIYQSKFYGSLSLGQALVLQMPPHDRYCTHSVYVRAVIHKLEIDSTQPFFLVGVTSVRTV
jgi:hypothetical protein